MTERKEYSSPFGPLRTEQAVIDVLREFPPEIMQHKGKILPLVDQRRPDGMPARNVLSSRRILTRVDALFNEPDVTVRAKVTEEEHSGEEFTVVREDAKLRGALVGLKIKYMLHTSDAWDLDVYRPRFTAGLYGFDHEGMLTTMEVTQYSSLPFQDLNIYKISRSGLFDTPNPVLSRVVQS